MSTNTSTAILNNIKEDLIQNVDEKTRESAQHFFKEEVKFYGVKTATVGKIATKHFKEVKLLSKSEIFELCEKLLSTGFNEDAFIAFDWIYRIRDNYEHEDFFIFENWIESYIDNWAKCDTFCNHSVAALVEQHPEFISNLKEWTQSDNRWVKRAAAVTLILPARHGKFLDDVFDIADKLLLDKDDLVQKGYGWLLKEASKSHLEEVFGYVMDHKKEMPRTALRYAIEKMPKELKVQAMQR
jgi:3-methyladenine DNA glycosylase AlkD